MFLTKKYLSRRTVLKGAGMTLALPLLDAMIPAATALAQTAAVPKMRMGFFYIPHGAIMGNTSFGPDMDRWTPSGSGADYKLSPILKSLEPLKRYVTSFGNLQNQAMAGGAHSLALKADGSVAAWGANWDGQCDLSPTTTNVVGIAAGEAHTLLLVEGSRPVLRLLNPARNGLGFRAVLQTLNRNNYTLEFKNSLTATSWTTLSTLKGNGSLIQLIDLPASGPQRFYRVRQW